MSNLPDWTQVWFGFGSAPDAVSPNWTDVSGYVDGIATVNVSHGRTDQFETVQAGTLGLTLNNKDGRFTAEYVSGAYYPNVTLATRVRVTTRPGTYSTAGVLTPATAGNFLTANQSSMESSVADWVAVGGTPPTLAQSNTHVQDGAQALRLTWPTGSGSGAATTVTGLVIGRTYTYSLYVYVPSGGSPAVYGTVAGLATTPVSAVTNAFTRLSCTFVATATSVGVGLLQNAASTSGQQVWVDAVMVDEGATAATFTTSSAIYYNRYDGCIGAWPTQWAATGVYSEAAVTASDRMQRLGLSGTLPDIIGCEYRQDMPYSSPSLYYNLGDSAGSTSAGNSSAYAQPNAAVTQRGSGGTATFGTATGPGTDGLTALQLAAVDASNGKYLQVTPNGDLRGGGGTTLSLECAFLTVNGNNQTMVAAGDTYGSYFYLATGNAVGFLKGGFVDPFGVATTALVSGAIVADGLTHTAVLTASVSAGTCTLTLYLDGSSVATNTYATPFLTSVGKVYVGGGPSPQAQFSGTLAHVGIFSNALSATRVTQHNLAATTGFAGERSDQRISRLVTYGGINASDVVASENGSSSLDAQDTSGAQVLDLINTATTTENGVALFAGSGKLVIQGRSHRYNRSTAATLAPGDYTADIQPVLDNFGVQNDVTASRAGGVTVRAVNQTSIGTIGVYTGQLDIIPNSDSEVIDAANWRVQTAGVPRSRFPTVTVDMAGISDAQRIAVLSLEVGDRIGLTGLPATAPASTADLFIEGWNESIGLQQWTITFNCSRVVIGSVWVLDSPTLSVLDSTTRLAY